MRVCPKCDARFEHDLFVCPHDGEVLAVAEDPLVGTVFDGMYEIEELLGRGGMGSVYLARHVLLRDRVAIKLLPRNFNADPEWLSRFVREGRAARAIKHPNAVTVHDLRSSGEGVLYMVLEYIDGETLRRVLEARRRLTPAEAVRILEPIASALDHAHAAGVVHRDLKPENIMVGSADGALMVKLFDLGIAKLYEMASSTEAGPEITMPGAVLGTPLYMSPEQWGALPDDGNDRVDGRADVYSLGVVAYEMVSGAKPFTGSNMAEIRFAHATATPRPLSEICVDVPEAFDAAVMRALAKDRGDRQPTAGRFVVELRAALGFGSTGGDTLAGGVELPTLAPRYVEEAVTEIRPAEAEPLRIALLYRRNVERDAALLVEIERAFVAHGHDVFVDRDLVVGMEWASEIERRLRSADAIVPLLSAESIGSEMLAHELRVAFDAWQEAGRPRLLPVRVDYEGPLPDEIAPILDPIQYVHWTGPESTDEVVARLLDALREPAPSRPSIPRRELEAEGGAVPLGSRFYIVRSMDDEFQDALARGDSVVLVKGARQMGKTSLLARGLQQARQDGARVILTDFQDLSASDLASAEALYTTLGEMIAEQLDLDVAPQDVWKSGTGANRNFGRYVREHVLERLGTRVVWGLDEADRLFTCDFGGEVFGLFRSWHNRRSLDPDGPWRHLTLAIAYATEAHLFITDINQSPFNVGTRVALDDFTIEQVEELNRRYGSPLRSSAEVARLHRLVGGHPFLVRRSLHELTQGVSIGEFEAVACRDEGPLGDHLRRILVLLAKDPVLTDVVRGVLRGKPCPTAESFYRLQSAGVLAGATAQNARPRCQLYATYLKGHLL